MRIASFLLKCLPFVLVFLAVWMVAVLFWRINGDVPPLGGMALVLVGVPVALIAGFFGLKKGIDMAKTGAFAKPRAAVQPDSMGDDANDAVNPERAFSLALLAGAIRVPHGADATELLAAIKDYKTPELHPTLIDHRGLPAYAAPVAAAAPDSAETAWDVLGQAQADRLGMRHRRALTLASQVLDELVLQAQPSADELTLAEPPVAASLEALVLLPDDWPEATRNAARDWLQIHADQSGEGGLRLQIKAMPVAGAAQALTVLDELRLTLSRRQLRAPQLLLACDSRIDDQTVHRWSVIGRLKASGNDEGLIPGEGAAGLLVAWPGPDEEGGVPELHSRTLRIHRVARGAHAQPVGGSRPLKEAILDDLIAEAVADAGCELDAIGCLVSDGDARSSRMLELAQTVDSTLPELDSGADTLSLGVVAGDCGCAAGLASIAVAAFQTQAHEQAAPSVVVSVSDAQARAALVVALPITDAQNGHDEQEQTSAA